MIVESGPLSDMDFIGTHTQASRSPTPLSRNPSPEGPLILSTVEGSSGERSTPLQSVTPHSPNQAPFHCHSEAPRGI